MHIAQRSRNEDVGLTLCVFKFLEQTKLGFQTFSNLFGFSLFSCFICVLSFVSFVFRDGNGAGLRWGSYPLPLPCYPCLIPHPRPVPFSGELSFPRPRPRGYPPRPNMNFYFLFHSFWLNYVKQKNFISMTTIDLLANQFCH